MKVVIVISTTAVVSGMPVSTGSGSGSGSGAAASLPYVIAQDLHPVQDIRGDADMPQVSSCTTTTRGISKNTHECM